MLCFVLPRTFPRRPHVPSFVFFKCPRLDRLFFYFRVATVWIEKIVEDPRMTSWSCFIHLLGRAHMVSSVAGFCPGFASRRFSHSNPPLAEVVGPQDFIPLTPPVVTLPLLGRESDSLRHGGPLPWTDPLFLGPLRARVSSSGKTSPPL